MPKSIWREYLKNKKIEREKNSKKRADMYSTLRRIAKKRFEDIRLIIENLSEEELDKIMLDPDIFPTVAAVSRSFVFAYHRKRDEEKKRRKAIREIKRTKIFDLKTKKPKYSI